MAQRVFWNYQEALTSFDLGKMLAGILFPGRYTGFDTKSNPSALNLSLTHAATGIQQSDINGSLTTKTGVWISPQGSVIQENATVVIGSVAANSSGNPRIDLIIGDYLKPVSSSASATYAIVTGTPAATPVAPANPDNTRKVILGYLLVPDGTTTDLSGCTYTKADIPLLGGEARPDYSAVANLSLSNSWTSTNVADNTKVDIEVRSGATNTMRFMNMVTSPVGINSDAIITTLPAYLRPREKVRVPVSCSAPGDVAGVYMGVVEIEASGKVQVVVPAATSLSGDSTTQVDVYLNHIIVPLD